MSSFERLTLSAMALLFVAGCDLFSTGSAAKATSTPAPVKNSSVSVAKTPDAATAPTTKKEKTMQEVAVISTRHGDIVIRFRDDLAPKHVESFKKLVKEGFYNGTSFHRVIPGFMIQGGDPESKNADNRSMHGTGGPGYSIKAEFSKTKHTRGIVSAARSMDPDSAGSQFFICVADSPWLDGQYSVFGEVVEGLDVADKIVNEPRDARDNPNERVEVTMTLEEREL